jgi:hypothetical protein
MLSVNLNVTIDNSTDPQRVVETVRTIHEGLKDIVTVTIPPKLSGKSEIELREEYTEVTEGKRFKLTADENLLKQTGTPIEQIIQKRIDEEKIKKEQRVETLPEEIPMDDGKHPYN